MMPHDRSTSDNRPARLRDRLRLTSAFVALALAAAAFGVMHAGTTLVVNAPVAAPDAIVSLASHEWERLPVTARLAQQFPKSKVILTLPPAASRRNCYECSHRVDILANLGIGRERVAVVQITQSNTYGESLAVRNYMRETGLRRLLIVTSAYHTRRALATFESTFDGNGTLVGVTPADPESYARPSRWWTRAYDRWYVTYEWSAVIWYRVHHGVPIGIGEAPSHAHL